MTQSQTSNQHTVSAIPAFNDNYIWAIGHINQTEITLVDPGDADVCLEYIKTHQKKLTHILITHHHQDHVGGVAQLTAYCQQQGWPLVVYGPQNDPVTCDHKLNSSHEITIDDIGLTLSIIDLPGHTLGHIAYYGRDMLFCGDTLFSGGCGRIFEGTPEQMFSSLNKLKNLPERTRVYCAHEYTLANLNFALCVEPNNAELIHFYNRITKLRKQGGYSIPSSIYQEKLINPFLRCDQANIHISVTEHCDKPLQEDIDVFTQLRLWKDQA